MYNSFVAMSGDPANFADQLQKQGLELLLGVTLPLEYGEKKLIAARQAAKKRHEERASVMRAAYTKACLQYGRTELRRLGCRPPDPFYIARWMRSQLEDMASVAFHLAAPFIEGGPPRLDGATYRTFLHLLYAFNVLAYPVFDKSTREAVWWDVGDYAAVNNEDIAELPEEAIPLLQVVTRVGKIPYDGKQSIFPFATVLDNPPYPTPWLDELHTDPSE